jgi:hypothetical protein
VQDGPLAAEDVVEPSLAAVGVDDPRLGNLPPDGPVAALGEKPFFIARVGNPQQLLIHGR